MRLLGKRKTKKRFSALVIILVILLLFTFLNFVPPRWLGSTTTSGARPFWQWRIAFSEEFGDFLESFITRKELARENRNLIAQIKSFETNIAELRALRIENEELKTLLGRVEGKDFTIASVLSRPNATPYDTLIIDLGSLDGANTGDRVFLSDGVILGEIDKAFTKTSRVLMYSTPDVETTAMLVPSNIEVTAIGVGGGNLVIRTPKELEVEEGEALILPGLSTAVIGIVEEITTHSSDVINTLHLRTPVSLSSLRFVFVEKK